MKSPAEIGAGMSALGVKRSRQPLSRMFALAVLAGVYLALAGVGATTAAATVENASVAKLISACAFPAGLAMILIAGGELFTGNCLIIIPVLERKLKVHEMLRNWIVVYIGNLLGALLICLLLNYGHTFSLFGNRLAGVVIDTAAAKTSISFTDGLLCGICCNVLVCLAVWMAAATDDAGGKVVALFFPILMFVVAGYEHCIANMYYIPAGILAASNPTYAAVASADLSSLNWAGFFVTNLIPVTIGNIIGGAGIVGFGYWFVNSRER